MSTCGYDGHRGIYRPVRRRSERENTERDDSQRATTEPLAPPAQPWTTRRQR